MRHIVLDNTVSGSVDTGTLYINGEPFAGATVPVTHTANLLTQWTCPPPDEAAPWEMTSTTTPIISEIADLQRRVLVLESRIEDIARTLSDFGIANIDDLI